MLAPLQAYADFVSCRSLLLLRTYSMQISCHVFIPHGRVPKPLTVLTKRPIILRSYNLLCPIRLYQTIHLLHIYRVLFPFQQRIKVSALTIGGEVAEWELLGSHPVQHDYTYIACTVHIRFWSRMSTQQMVFVVLQADG